MKKFLLELTIISLISIINNNTMEKEIDHNKIILNALNQYFNQNQSLTICRIKRTIYSSLIQIMPYEEEWIEKNLKHLLTLYFYSFIFPNKIIDTSAFSGHLKKNFQFKNCDEINFNLTTFFENIDKKNKFGNYNIRSPFYKSLKNYKKNILSFNYMHLASENFFKNFCASNKRHQEKLHQELLEQLDF